MMAHRSLADEIIDLQVAQVRVENAQHRVGERLTVLERRVRRSWIGPTLGTMVPLLGAIVGGFFTLQAEREKTAAMNRAQAREVARQETLGPIMTSVAEKASRMALEAHDRAREQDTRRLVREMLAQAPLQRDPDLVSGRQ